MLTAVNEVFELVATVLCINYLYRKRYYFSFIDVLFLMSELIMLESINHFGFEPVVSFAGYAIILIYSKIKFRKDNKTTIINLVLYLIVGVVLQLLINMPLLLFESYINVDVLVLITNALFIAAVAFIGYKGFLYTLSECVIRRNWVVNAVIACCLISVLCILVVYRYTESFRDTDYIIYGILIFLLCALVMVWQKTYDESSERKRELEMHNTYGKIYSGLIDSVRSNQHAFSNHLTAIKAMLYRVSDEDARDEIEKYVSEVLKDNRYSTLLSNSNSIFTGFLYYKFTEAERKGLSVDYDVTIDSLKSVIPIHKLVDITGILIDNAVEAALSCGGKKITCRVNEYSDSIHIFVMNPYPLVSRDEIKNYLKKCYSTKGTGRGLGLSDAVNILLKYNQALNLKSECVNNIECFIAEIKIALEE